MSYRIRNINRQWYVEREDGELTGPFTTSWDAIGKMQDLRAGRTSTMAGEMRTKKDEWVKRERQKEVW